MCGTALAQIAEIREVTRGAQAHCAQPAITRRRRPPRAKIREVPGHFYLRTEVELSVASYPCQHLRYIIGIAAAVPEREATRHIARAGGQLRR